MEYVHVRNLEKYHPGYKDRTLQWAKIYINMADGDPDTELITNEVDWARLVKIILLELRAQKPLPNDDTYWHRKGFNLKTRPMSLTLKVLHNFLDTVTQEDQVRYESVTQIREDKEEDKDKNKTVPDEVFISNLKTNKAYDHINLDIELSKMDAWLQANPGRKKTRRFVVNWLNKQQRPLESSSNPFAEVK